MGSFLTSGLSTALLRPRHRTLSRVEVLAIQDRFPAAPTPRFFFFFSHCAVAGSGSLSLLRDPVSSFNCQTDGPTFASGTLLMISSCSGSLWLQTSPEPPPLMFTLDGVREDFLLEFWCLPDVHGTHGFVLEAVYCANLSCGSRRGFLLSKSHCSCFCFYLCDIECYPLVNNHFKSSGNLSGPMCGDVPF